MDVRIGGIIDISTIDWKGHVSSVIFFAGCNFKCPYCHNFQLIPLDSGHESTIEQIEKQLLESKPLIDSIVISGGEPLLQHRALEEICLIARKHDLEIMIQTNGSKPEVLDSLLSKGLLDCIALDFKTTPAKYHLVGGTAPIEAMKIIEKYDIEAEIRTTLAYEVIDENDIEIMRTMIPKGGDWVFQEKRDQAEIFK